MYQKSGELKINDFGKLIYTGEIFDDHNSFDFEAFIDTGNDFGVVLTSQLANAVCAEVEEDIKINTGAGLETIPGQKRKVNLRFGNLLLKNYSVTVLNGTRNLVGISFLQEHGILMIVDFKKGKTEGGVLTNDQTFANVIKKTSRCYFGHKNDSIKSNEKCPICDKSEKDEQHIV